MKRFAFLMVLVLGSFGLSACGGKDLDGKCKDACEKKPSCSDATDAEKASGYVDSCKAACTTEENVIDASDCGDKADKYSDCIGEIDVCTGDDDNDQCGAQQTALANCVRTFCSAHTDNASCKAFSE